MSIQQNKIRAIIEKIWSKVKTPQPMCGDDIVNAIDEVYTSGEDNGIAEMWEGIQNGGKQETYYERFRNWKITKKTFAPKYDIRSTATNGLNYAFVNFHKADSNEIIDFEEIERECGIVIDFSTCQVMHNTFQAAEIDVVNVFDARNANGTNALYSTFRGSFDSGSRPEHHTVKRINKFIVGENTNNFYMTFYYANDLEHCVFEGEISKNGLSFAQSTKLDHESIMSVINCLKDYSQDTSGTTYSVQFGATNLAKLTAEEKAIAAQKGWNLT